MRTAIIYFVIGFNYFVGAYFGIVNTIYAGLLMISLFAILRHIRRVKYSPIRDFRSSPETPPVSILMPVHNEEKTVIRSIRAALSIDYPLFQVILINDGSEDSTLQAVIETFRLKRIDRVYRNFLKTEAVRGFYYSNETPNLLVIDKVRGGKADALNCGINGSQSPYFCSVDADSLLEKDALIRLMTPVLESGVPVIACGGVVRVLNGVEVGDNLAIHKINLSDKPLVLFQIVEYLRGFLFGRVGWDALNSLLIISGTFSLFHKATVLEAGGFKIGNVSEDMEIIVRLHKMKRLQKKPYRIRFISDPICWTEVPENVKMLARQRRRWHLGLIQSIFQNREMIFNPRYGTIGMLVMPYYVFFEIIGPFIEILGYIVVLLSFAVGLLAFKFFLLFITLAIFYGIFLSTAGIFLEELTYRRYPGWGHMFLLLFYGVLENLGYRQISSFWRLQAMFRYLTGRTGWEYVENKGARAGAKSEFAPPSPAQEKIALQSERSE
jgi:cellulose synthase/poly-beta-1,6-N-acetylglucosamine synthase-like glycosyltransferase